MIHTTRMCILVCLLACADAPDAGDAPMGLDFTAIAGSAAPPPEPIIYPTHSGGSLPVRHYASEASDVFVLIHGSGYHSRYLASLAERLAGVGAAHVYTPDLRGHGVDPERRGDIDYVDQLEDDLVDLIGWVRERHAGGRIFVGGHSSGGGLALRFAGGGGEASGLVLLAPYLAHDAPTLRAGNSAGGWAQPKIPRIILLSILNGFGVHAFDDVTTIEFSMPEEARDGTETLAYSHRLNVGYAPRNWQ
ncbi:MAG: alpha/beta fold hydrolase, partial [Deltaproteobacteria bacterium]|nr:alpha/beta fold hydrolase [Deltaproteobacteria bacterium]